MYTFFGNSYGSIDILVCSWADPKINESKCPAQL